LAAKGKPPIPRGEGRGQGSGKKRGSNMVRRKKCNLQIFPEKRGVGGGRSQPFPKNVLKVPKGGIFAEYTKRKKGPLQGGSGGRIGSRNKKKGK